MQINWWGKKHQNAKLKGYWKRVLVLLGCYGEKKEEKKKKNKNKNNKRNDK